MHKNSKIVIFIFISTLYFTITCNASNKIEVNQLIENAAVLDNTEVTVKGEVIGEALERGEYAWINISDTTNAIGIWIKQSDVNQIKYYGDYKHKGDTVKVTGVFHKACPEHGGDVDIHCTNIEIVETGYNIKEQLSSNKVIITLLLVLITIIAAAAYLKLKKESL